jgi:hypothetical protein
LGYFHAKVLEKKTIHHKAASLHKALKVSPRFFNTTFVFLRDLCDFVVRKSLPVILRKRREPKNLTVLLFVMLFISALNQQDPETSSE